MCCDILGVVSCGITCLYCCPPSLQKYKEYEKDVAIEEIDGLQLVKKLAKNMEEMFHKKSEAVRVSDFAFCSVLSEDPKAVSGTNSPRSKLTPLLHKHVLFFSIVNQEK